jgi:hypothetical protein
VNKVSEAYFIVKIVINLLILFRPDHFGALKNSFLIKEFVKLVLKIFIRSAPRAILATVYVRKLRL